MGSQDVQKSWNWMSGCWRVYEIENSSKNLYYIKKAGLNYNSRKEAFNKLI